MFDWGSVPDWVQAFGNIAVLGAAFEAIRREHRRTLKLEQENAAQRAEAARERISNVSAWPEDWSTNDIHVECRNGNSEPVYEVVVRAAASLNFLYPPIAGSSECRSIFLMRPGEQLDVSIGVDSAIVERPYVDVSFRDSNNVAWWRRGDGQLERIGEAG